MAIHEPINKVNLERITNGIFAFTMTLLARNIITSDKYEQASQITIEHFVEDTIFSIFDFLGVFILLAMFWMLFFQMFHRMKTYDYHFLHVHMLALMAIVLIPFSSSFSNLGENDYIFVDYFFQINYFFLGILLAYLWYYAGSHPALLDPDLIPSETTCLLKKCLVPPFVAALGIFWVFADLPGIEILYFVPFVILGIFFRNPPDNPVS
ncbi:TMEM175 family protein [Methanospirillum stamsii]|uniref:DUF1211 domain-containing protein n=1 Tax=Methanospirillum stamsii TaxID=1277351 RepID=A0A2V2MZX8_9EURY|nr:TMEM175 family protein [Methanospirillum stamsii]PWR71885.1 hypothetical protein DLD82_12760 [Methanospirillum stamsii]